MMRDRACLPELDNLGLSGFMFGLGFVGGATELTTTAFVPRLVLYALLFAIGTFGLIRRCCRARRVRG